MMTTVDESQTVQQLSQQILEKIFGESAQVFNMQAGTVLSNTDVRVIYLSSDIIHAIYDVLKYEAGDAWALILKNCGLVWGKRVVISLEKELAPTTHKKLGYLSVDSYMALLTAYFANHGWGKMHFYLDDAQSHGIIRASLHYSLFADTLKQINEPVDYMIAGMLQSIFSDISQQPLRCVQVSYNHFGKQTSEFLISGAERIAGLEQFNLHDLELNDALAQLRIT